MNDITNPAAAAELLTLRSIRDTEVIFRVGETSMPAFYEKVGEQVVPVPQRRAHVLTDLVFGTEDLTELGFKTHRYPTVPFSYRRVMLTTTGNAVLRTAGA